MVWNIPAGRNLPTATLDFMSQCLNQSSELFLHCFPKSNRYYYHLFVATNVILVPNLSERSARLVFSFPRSELLYSAVLTNSSPLGPRAV